MFEKIYIKQITKIQVLPKVIPDKAFQWKDFDLKIFHKA